MRGQKITSYENILTAVLALTFGVVFFDRNSLNFLMPFVLKEIALSNTQIGMLASGLALTWAASGFVIGLLSDRIGRRKPLLIAAVVVFSLSSFITGLGHSFIVLLGARILMGLAEGPVLPISQSLMAEASSPGRRGLNMGLMQNVLSNLMGSLVAPLVVVAVASTFGWRVAFYITVVPGLLAALLIFLFVNEPKMEIASDTLRVGKANLLQAVLASRNVCLCIAISGLMVGWMVIGWVFLPLYFTSLGGFSPTQMSLLMSVLGISGSVAGFVVPGLSDRFGRRPIMILGCFLGVITPVAALSGASSVTFLTTLVAMGWMAGGTFSIFMATIPSESAPRTLVTTAMALSMGMGELFGGAAAPTIVGHFADIYGLTAAPIAQIIFAGLAGILSLALIETAPRRQLLSPTHRELPAE